MKIKPLSKKTLNEAISLVIKIFGSKPSDADYPGKWMPASLEGKERNFELYNSTKCTSVKYYVGTDEKSGKVIGVTGIYTQAGDEEDCAWITWYCVDPDYRGRGFGAQLLDFTIAKAREMGKKFLRLYTSVNEDVEKAMNLYKKRGFVETREGWHPDTQEKLINLELRL